MSRSVAVQRDLVAWRTTASALVLAAATVTLAVVSTRVATSGWPGGSGTVTPRADDVALGLMAWVAAALASWLALGAVLTALALLPGAAGGAFDRCARQLTPRPLRRLIAMLLGVCVATLTLPAGAAWGAGGDPALDRQRVCVTAFDAPSPAFAVAEDASSTPVVTPAAPATVADPADSGAPPTPVPDPGWRPSRPHPVHDEESTQLLAPVPRPGGVVIDQVTVRRGDTLWGIAARHLGAEASDAQIAREWPRWYAANREVIGDDPDRILAGQQLRPPSHDLDPTTEGARR